MTEKEKHIERDLHKYSLALKVRTPSECTHNNYLSIVKRFLNTFDKNIGRATTTDLTEYILLCKSRSLMAQTRAAIKLFYELVYNQKNKVEFIPYPKQEERLKDVPTHEQMMRIIEGVENTKHKLILMMLYGTGMRCNELLQIKWKDIRREQGINPLSVKVHGKGAKDRFLPLSEHIYSLLMEYCQKYNLGCKTNKNNFVFGNDRPYSAKSVSLVVERAGLLIGFKLTPHLIRHACMTSLSIHGMPLLELQDLCGHASAKTTRIYAKSNNVNRIMPI